MLYRSEAVTEFFLLRGEEGVKKEGFCMANVRQIPVSGNDPIRLLFMPLGVPYHIPALAVQ